MVQNRAKNESRSKQKFLNSAAPACPCFAVGESDEYPNTTEGLQNLMNDVLSATRRGDREKVGELMKQTEFADYATIL